MVNDTEQFRIELKSLIAKYSGEIDKLFVNYLIDCLDSYDASEKEYTELMDVPIEELNIVKRITDHLNLNSESMSTLEFACWEFASNLLVDCRNELRRLQIENMDLRNKMNIIDKKIVFCYNCGLDWVDDGLNPLGCPYCELSRDNYDI